MAYQSKRFRASARRPPSTRSPADAVRQLKTFDTTKFVQTVEVSTNLGIDPRQSDQNVRGSVALPHGIGKAVRVAVFAQGDNAEKATAAGADIVGGDDLAQRVKAGFMDFDVALATPDMMGVVGPLGRVLGPRGLMPSPRRAPSRPTSPPPSASSRRARSSSATTRAATSPPPSAS